MKNIIVLLFIVVSNTCMAQSSILGQVLDADTNEPIIGASVHTVIQGRDILIGMVARIENTTYIIG